MQDIHHGQKTRFRSAWKSQHSERWCIVRVCRCLRPFPVVLQIYKDCRNLIIDKYRESPKQRLEFAAVKDAIAESDTSTDLKGLQRIYEFLDAWGLINYEATDGASHSLDSLPPAVAASGVSHHVEVTNVH